LNEAIMNARVERSAPPPQKSAPKVLDLHQIFSWMLADGLIDKADAKVRYNEAQALLRNASIR
jgi:general secretion pathway protein E